MNVKEKCSALLQKAKNLPNSEKSKELLEKLRSELDTEYHEEEV